MVCTVPVLLFVPSQSENQNFSSSSTFGKKHGFPARPLNVLYNDNSPEGNVILIHVICLPFTATSSLHTGGNTSSTEVNQVFPTLYSSPAFL
jgi:hypothetical protein